MSLRNLIAKALTLLGFASKAGKLGCGFSKAQELLKKQKSKLIIVACDISEKSKKEILFSAEKNHVEALTLKSIDIFQLSNAVGHKCGIISVNDNGFKEAIKEEILNDQ